MPGLCAADHFEVVDVMTLPPQAVLWKKIVAGHRAVGCAGGDFLPPLQPLVIVVGVDEISHDGIGVVDRARPGAPVVAAAVAATLGGG